MRIARYTVLAVSLALGLSLFAARPQPAAAASAVEIDAEVDAALTRFYQEVPAAQELAKKAKGILIFPRVVKAGFGAASMARERSGSRADRSATTTSPAPRSAFRSESRRAPRSCCS